MKRSTKIWLVAASLLVLTGAAIFVAVMSSNGWDFSELSASKYETNVYEIRESFGSLSVKTDTADVIFALSDSEECRVECYEESKSKHRVVVEEDTLVVSEVDNRKWYDYIGFYFESPRVTIYLPESEYAALDVECEAGSVKLASSLSFDSIDISSITGDISCLADASGKISIETSTGDISVKSRSAGSLELKSSTGDIEVSDLICASNADITVTTGNVHIKDVECASFSSGASTGNISLDNLVADGALSVERSTGNVEFEGIDAGEIFIKTVTGNVEGSFLTEKVFIVNSDTGRIDVPDSVTGGRCEIITGTGNIKVTL